MASSYWLSKLGLQSDYHHKRIRFSAETALKTPDSLYAKTLVIHFGLSMSIAPL